MVTLLTIVHIVGCLFLILVVLLQAGKGGGMGIAFGGGGSQTVFGSSGAGNFLTRLTSITAAVFLVTSLTLAHYSSRQDNRRLQQLASEKATQKKAEEDKAAKMKAELDKERPATSTPATKDATGLLFGVFVVFVGVLLVFVFFLLVLKKPELGGATKPASSMGLAPKVAPSAEAPAVPAVTKPAAAPKPPAAVRKPVVHAKPAAPKAEGDEPASAPAPSEPAAPAPAAPSE